MEKNSSSENAELIVDVGKPVGWETVFPEEIHKGSREEKLKRFNALRKSPEVNVMFAAEYLNFVLGDMSDAIEEYKKVISEHGSESLANFSGFPRFAFQAPFSIEIFSNIRIAYCYCALKKYPEAAEYFQKGYPWRPFYYESAECYLAAGDKPNAVLMYKKAYEYHLSSHWGSDPEFAEKAKRRLDLIKTKK
ncbi:MAG TPA: hypothetical protein PK624_09270 [Spirochaetota bacterium]|nr:hypothetical protein [Spirochaetota bacterium]HOR44973.1 hypothetical protein [Spirochaetota bacterium]HPK56700.1 hypothetical protein [Spirochaetota bacterium]